MRNIFQRTLMSAAVLALASASACKQRDTWSSAASKVRVEDISKRPGSVYQVTYNDNTVVVDRATVSKALRGISRDHMDFLFDNSADAIQHLAVGKVVLLEGLALRRVVAMTPAGASRVEVLTERAAPTDAIREGTVQFRYPINFGSLGIHGTTAESQPFGPFRLPDALRSWFDPPVAWAATTDAPVSFTKDFNGWHCEVNATSSFNRIEAKAKFKKQYEGATLEVAADGYISNFETLYDLEVHDRKMKYFDWRNKNLNGALNVDWHASHQESGVVTGEQRLSFTIPGFATELEIKGLPLSLSYGGALLFRPGFTGKGELAHGKFQVNYNGVQGFNVKAGNASSSGEMHGDNELIEAPAFSAIGPEAMINGVVLPRIELSFEAGSRLGDAFEKLPFWNPTPRKLR